MHIDSRQRPILITQPLLRPPSLLPLLHVHRQLPLLGAQSILYLQEFVMITLGYLIECLVRISLMTQKHLLLMSLQQSPCASLIDIIFLHSWIIPYIFMPLVYESYSILSRIGNGRIKSYIFLSKVELILFPLRSLLWPLVQHHLLLLKPNLHLNHDQLF